MTHKRKYRFVRRDLDRDQRVKRNRIAIRKAMRKLTRKLNSCQLQTS